ERQRLVLGDPVVGAGEEEEAVNDEEVRPTERSSGQRSNSGREEMGCSGQRSSNNRSASLAMPCDIVGPIAAKQRKKERKQSNGFSVSIYCVSAGSSSTLEHSRALRLQGRRPLVPMCRSVGEAGDWGGGRDFTAPVKERMSRLWQ
ncbi:hypothetical protein B296_00022214, partial [Ensete ventricosum]